MLGSWDEGVLDAEEVKAVSMELQSREEAAGGGREVPWGWQPHVPHAVARGDVMGAGCHHQPGVLSCLAGETWGHEAPLGRATRQMGLGRGRKRSSGPLRE